MKKFFSLLYRDYLYLAFFLLALIVRLIFIWQWSGTPYFSHFNADAWVHDVWAQNIAAGEIIRHTAFYQSPLYPYLLAVFYKIFGHHFWPVYIFQALMDAFSCFFIAKSAKMMFNRRTAAMAGLISALYVPFIFNTGLLLKETLVVFCVSSSLLLLLHSLNRQIGKKSMLAFSAGWGAMLGAAALSRPNMAGIFFFAALWVIYRAVPDIFSFSVKKTFKKISENADLLKKIIKKNILPAFLGMFLLMMPQTLHNAIASHDLVLFNYAGGFVFYLGSSQYADGTISYPPGFTSAPLQEEMQIYEIAENETGRKLKPSEVSSFWLRQGIKAVKENPRRFFGLTLGKFYLFWNKYEVPDNYDLSFIRRHYPTVISAPLFVYAFVASLGVLGMFMCGLNRRSGILPALFWPYMLSLMPFIITDRYRIPAVVFLIIAAAYAINRLYIKFVADAGKVLPAIACSLFFWLIIALPTPCNLIFAEATGYANLACKYAKSDENLKAVKCFEQAEALHADAVGESAAMCAAYSYGQLGRDSLMRHVINSYGLDIHDFTPESHQ